MTACSYVESEHEAFVFVCTYVVVTHIPRFLHSILPPRRPATHPTAKRAGSRQLLQIVKSALDAECDNYLRQNVMRDFTERASPSCLRIFAVVRDNSTNIIRNISPKVWIRCISQFFATSQIYFTPNIFFPSVIEKLSSLKLHFWSNNLCNIFYI